MPIFKLTCYGQNLQCSIFSHARARFKRTQEAIRQVTEFKLFTGEKKEMGSIFALGVPLGALAQLFLTRSGNKTMNLNLTSHTIFG